MERQLERRVSEAPTGVIEKQAPTSEKRETTSAEVLTKTPWHIPLHIARWSLHGLASFYVLRRLLSIVILLVVDALALLGGLAIASYWLSGSQQAGELLYHAPPLVVVWLAIFAAHGLYDRAASRRNPATLLGADLIGSGLLVFVTVIYPRLIGEALYSGLKLKVGEVLFGLLLAFLIGAGLRLLYEEGAKLLHRQELGLVPTLFIGEDEARKRVHRAVKRAPVSTCICVGELPTAPGGIDLRALRSKLDQTRAKQVIVAGAEHFSEEKFIEFLRACRLRRVEVKLVPSAVTLLGCTATLSQEVGTPLLRVGYPTLDGPQRTIKRLLDMISASGALVALSPLFLAMALAVRATSPGPILFRQKRVGVDEKAFTFYKIRSMYEDAERRQEELEALNEADGAVFKMKNDPRVTPVGRFLRRWSLDELPQLINVLKGEMSLVGPRPLPVRDFERMEEKHKRRLGAIPGMTGYWQTSGRSDLSFEDMVRLDLYYIENWSLSLDVKITFKTLRVVLYHSGAY